MGGAESQPILIVTSIFINEGCLGYKDQTLKLLITTAK
jgi:hypothetical protein